MRGSFGSTITVAGDCDCATEGVDTAGSDGSGGGATAVRGIGVVLCASAIPIGNTASSKTSRSSILPLAQPLLPCCTARRIIA